MKTHRLLAAPALLLALLATPAAADVPLQFATVNVRAPNDPHVNGVRFSVLHGRNESIRGVDLGLISSSHTSRLTGFSAILGINRIDGSVRGCSAAVVNLHRGRDRGVNAAFVNQVRAMDAGANIGVVNISEDFAQVDVGGINVSKRGLVQVGFLNVTDRIQGVQIGFLNLAENGFLPVFPFFNFPRR